MGEQLSVTIYLSTNTMIRPGKVESIILTEKEIYQLSNGNYVLYDGKVAQIQEPKKNIKIVSTGQLISLSRDEMSMLKRIVVTLKYGLKPGKIEIRRFPLKFEQWQRCIDTHILDSDIPVSFEVLSSSYISRKNDSKITTFIAIIHSGSNKYTYTDSEVKFMVNNAMFHAVSRAILDINGALIIEQEEIDRWWEYNRYF